MFVAATASLLLVAGIARAWIPPDRFTDNGNGTVSDNVTGLMWQQEDDNNAYTWQHAVDWCAGLLLAGHSDWRLPNVKELSSLVNEELYNLAIDGALFPGTESNAYWSSSSYASNTNYAWHVDFYYGNTTYGDKASNYYARCVRP